MNRIHHSRIITMEQHIVNAPFSRGLYQSIIHLVKITVHEISQPLRELFSEFWHSSDMKLTCALYHAFGVKLFVVPFLSYGASVWLGLSVGQQLATVEHYNYNLSIYVTLEYFCNFLTELFEQSKGSVEGCQPPLNRLSIKER